MSARHYRLRLLDAVSDQMAAVLDETAQTFGTVQADAYEELIQLALRDLSENAPFIGIPCPAVHPDARLYRIARRGRRARHAFLYRVRDDVVEVGAFVYDAMDFVRHVPDDWQQ